MESLDKVIAGLCWHKFPEFRDPMYEIYKRTGALELPPTLTSLQSFPARLTPEEQEKKRARWEEILQYERWLKGQTEAYIRELKSSIDRDAAQARKLAAEAEAAEAARKERELEDAAAALIDWDFWCAMPSVKTWEACALSISIDPDKLQHEPNARLAGPGKGPLFLLTSFPTKAAEEKFSKRLRLLTANRSDSSKFSHGTPDEVRLDEFVAWAKSVNWLLPSRLAVIELRVIAPAGSSASQIKSTEDEAIAQQGLPAAPQEKQRLSEIRAELALLDKVDESPPMRNESHSVPVQKVTAAPAPTPAPVQRTAAQDAALLAMLIEKGFDPLALPPNEAGKPGVKNLIRQALGNSGLWAGATVFDKAWERLSRNGDIAYKG